MQVAKKWKGGLYLNDEERFLCEVYYEAKFGASDLGRSMKSTEEQKLVAVKQFPEAAFLSLIYPAFEAPQEYGILTGVDIPDSRKLDKLVAYMEWKQHVCELITLCPACVLIVIALRSLLYLSIKRSLHSSSFVRQVSQTSLAP